jgi:hypothetical protein
MKLGWSAAARSAIAPRGKPQASTRDALMRQFGFTR